MQSVLRAVGAGRRVAFAGEHGFEVAQRGQEAAVFALEDGPAVGQVENAGHEVFVCGVFF